MIQDNYFTNNKDILLHFEKAINWDEIIESCEHGFQDHQEYKKSGNELLALSPASTSEALDTYRAFLESVGDLAGNFVAPRATVMDKEGLKFENGEVIFPQDMIACYEKAKEAGIIPYSLSRHCGGLGFPFTINSFFYEIMARADSAFTLTVGTINIGETIERYAQEGLVKEWVPQMVAGKLWCAMALTEPNYGSDLPNIQTKAEKGSDGRWRLNGTKRFITHGCGFNGIPCAILTLARSGKAGSGARGLSFFLVKSSDAQIAGIEKKMGLHCSPTCEVVYEDSPAILIGEEGHGLSKYAMGMMNSARLAVAAQSLGIAEAAAAEARKYASERVQFGQLIQDIPAVRKMLRQMERELAAMRCILYEASRSVDLYIWPKQRAEKKGKTLSQMPRGFQARKWEKLANFFTPLAKYYISETCNSLAYDAIQIHGGAGYTEEYDVARIYRDARITNLYEGTTQLQIIAAISGISAGMTPKGYLRKYIQQEMQGFSPSLALQELYRSFEDLSSSFRNIKDSETKDELAFEAVASAARFLGSMLLERFLIGLTTEEQEKRSSLINAFHIDSQAITTANLFRIQSLSQAATSSSPATKSV